MAREEKAKIMFDNYQETYVLIETHEIDTSFYVRFYFLNADTDDEVFSYQSHIFDTKDAAVDFMMEAYASLNSFFDVYPKGCVVFENDKLETVDLDSV